MKDLKQKLNLKTIIISYLITFYFILSFFAPYSIKYVLLLIVASFLITPITYILIEKTSINFKKNKKDKVDKIKRYEYFVYLSLILFVFIIYFIGYYPGRLSFDSIDTWNQVQSGVYQDWHPYAYTFLFIKLPSLIWNTPAACTLFQIIIISFILLYMCYVLRKYGLKFIYVLILLIYYLLNPSNNMMAITLWKDVPYSYFILLTTCLLIELYFSNGSWINNKRNLILFIIGISGILFFRHNGVLCFIPLLLYLSFVYRRKLYIVLLIAIFSFKVILTGPIYNMLNIAPHPSSFIEASGVLFNQLSYIYNNNGKINKNAIEIYKNIAPLETWKKYYKNYSFNDMKWEGSINNEYIESNKGLILRTVVNLDIKNPKLAIESFLYVTSPIWRIYPTPVSLPIIGVGQKIYKDYPAPEISSKLEKNLNNYFYGINNGVNGFAKYIFVGVGGALFLIIISLLISYKKQILNLKLFSIYLLVITNTIFICMLITGEEIRFVYSNITCFIPIFALPFLKENKYEKID